MSHKAVGKTLIKISTVYLLIGLLMGLVMGVTGGFWLSSVHAHISLLGWATMSITAVVYMVMPACGDSKLAGLHFWGHNLGLPVMTVSLVMLTYGFKGAEKGVAGGSALVIASLLAFCINIFLNAARESAGHEKAATESDALPLLRSEASVHQLESGRDEI